MRGADAGERANRPYELQVTYFWIKEQLGAELKADANAGAAYASSLIVPSSAPKELGHLRASDSEEFGKK